MFSDVIHSSLEPIVGMGRPAETYIEYDVLVSQSTVYHQSCSIIILGKKK